MTWLMVCLLRWLLQNNWGWRTRSWHNYDTNFDWSKQKPGSDFGFAVFRVRRYHITSSEATWAGVKSKILCKAVHCSHLALHYITQYTNIKSFNSTLLKHQEEIIWSRTKFWLSSSIVVWLACCCLLSSTTLYYKVRQFFFYSCSFIRIWHTLKFLFWCLMWTQRFGKFFPSLLLSIELSGG